VGVFLSDKRVFRIGEGWEYPGTKNAMSGIELHIKAKREAVPAIEHIEQMRMTMH
jgi:hypothetical protein